MVIADSTEGCRDHYMTANARNSFAFTIAIFGTGLFSCLAFGLILSHRMDYVGHYAAGFGGTLGLLTLSVAAIRQSGATSIMHSIVLVATIISIGIGAVAEATIFRLAQFDLIDFCNQSIGATLAALSFTAGRPSVPLGAPEFATGVMGAALFLLAGFILAFA